jgi:hypothetical protein
MGEDMAGETCQATSRLFTDVPRYIGPENCPSLGVQEARILKCET